MKTINLFIYFFDLVSVCFWCCVCVFFNFFNEHPNRTQSKGRPASSLTKAVKRMIFSSSKTVRNPLDELKPCVFLIVFILFVHLLVRNFFFCFFFWIDLTLSLSAYYLGYPSFFRRRIKRQSILSSLTVTQIIRTREQRRSWNKSRTLQRIFVFTFPNKNHVVPVIIHNSFNKVIGHVTQGIFHSFFNFLLLIFSLRFVNPIDKGYYYYYYYYY